MSDSRSTPPARWVDLIIPGLAVSYAVYYIASVRSFPFEAQISGLLLGALLTGLCGLFLVRFLWQARMAGTTGGGGPLLGDGALRGQRLGFLALIVLSVAALPWGGFTLTTFVFLLASFLLFGVRPLHRAAAVAAAAALGGWLFFVVLLGTRLPRGAFEALIGGLT